MFQPKKILLSVEPAEFQAQADAFLGKAGFPVTDDFRKLFGTFIQHLSSDEDSFDPALLKRQMRKAMINEQAFYLIHPEKRPTKEVANEEAGSEAGSPVGEETKA